MFPFSMADIAIYVINGAALYYCFAYVKKDLKFNAKWPLTVAIVLLPLWMTNIYVLGRLIFNYNLLPFILFYACALLGYHLYEYVRRINHFSFNKYYLRASKILFLHLSCFLLGLIVLRWIVLFLG